MGPIHIVKEKYRALLRHRFIKDTAVLQIGNVSGTFIQGVVSIVLARLLGPEPFGIYSLAYGFAGVLVAFYGITSQDSITALVGDPYARGDRRSVHAAFAFVFKIIGITALGAVISFAVAPPIAAHFYGNAQVGVYAAVFALSLFLTQSLFAFGRVATQIVGRIVWMTWLGVGDQVARGVLAVVLVVAGLGVGGAISGQLAGSIIVSCVALAVIARIGKVDGFIPSLHETMQAIRSVPVRLHLRFSVFIAVDRNLSMLFSMLPVALAGIFVSATEVGYFRLAFSYMNLVLSLFVPVSLLLNTEFISSNVSDTARLREQFIRVSLWSFAFSVVLTGIAVAIAPLFFRYIYGVAFLPSVAYVRELAVYGALFGIGVGLGPMWRAVKQVHVSIIINAVTLGIGIPIGTVLLRHFGVSGAVVLVTAWYSVSHVTSFFYLSRALRRIGP